MCFQDKEKTSFFYSNSGCLNHLFVAERVKMIFNIFLSIMSFTLQNTPKFLHRHAFFSQIKVIRINFNN